MTTIELTDEQRQALQTEGGKPVDVVDPATQQRYVLLARELFERVRMLLEQETGREPTAVSSDIPPGILRSQQAFWRDLPQLLSQKKFCGQWVCYHGDERIGIAKDDVPLLRECIRRGMPDDAYYLAEIRPRTLAPWETEEIAPLKPIHYGPATRRPETGPSDLPT